MSFNWKNVSLATGAIVICLMVLYHFTGTNAVAVPVQPTTTIVSPSEVAVTATDWNRCIESTATPDNKAYTFDVTLHNKCNVMMNTFSVTFKLYDATDARIGWSTTSVSALDPDEKVHWRQPYPDTTKDDPYVDLPRIVGVARLQVAEFKKADQ